MLATMYAALALLPILVLVWIVRCIRAPIAKVPGPKYTIFTDIILKYHEFTQNRRLYVHELHERYGPVVRLGPSEVSFASAEAIKEIYTSGGSGYDKTVFYKLFQQFGTPTLFSCPPKAQHSYIKRYVADRYANTNVMKPESLTGLAELAKECLANCLGASASSAGFADVYINLHCFALDGASHHMFHPYGTHANVNERDLELMKENSYHSSTASRYLKYYIPWLSSLIESTLKPRDSPLSNDYVLNVCKQPSPAPFSLLSKLQAQAKADSSMSPYAVPAECMDHLAAGIDTTGDALCFLMYQLSLPTASSQQIQSSLHEELVSNPNVPFDQLPYLDCVVKEGLRCFPPIPMSLPRQVPAGGRGIDGFWLPENTIVSSQAWTVHKNPIVFPRPLEFIPDRWLDKAGEQERNRLSFAFSTGARGCLGRHLALAEMKLLLREVYSQCRTTVSSQHTADMEMEDQIISTRPRDQSCKLVFEKIA